MNLVFSTPLNGRMVLTDELHNHHDLLKDKSLYKFLSVESGELTLEIDYVQMQLKAGEVITLSPLHHLLFTKIEGSYQSLLFNSNFYCIYEHDKEVSCNGFLFNGTSQIMKLELKSDQKNELNHICEYIQNEFGKKDSLQEEMLRLLLKQFIITYTRWARSKYHVGQENENSFDLVRRFFILVDNHYREKKQVQDYADLLNRSPKTLTNLFLTYGLPSPLKVIQSRTEAESKRLLLYTTKSAKEISNLLGFDEPASFSRFFKNVTGESVSDFRNREKKQTNTIVQ